MRNLKIWIICWASWSMLTWSFVPLSSSTRYPRNPFSTKKTNLPSPDTSLRLAEFSFVMVAEETASSWRQYIPLVVSAFVILDILLGSPAANSAMGLLRAQQDEKEASEEGASSRPAKRRTVNSAERVDSLAVAQAAIDKANATLELKRFLEDKKTDWDKMEDIRKTMDRQMQEFDEKIKEQREQQ